MLTLRQALKRVLRVIIFTAKHFTAITPLGFCTVQGFVGAFKRTRQIITRRKFSETHGNTDRQGLIFVIKRGFCNSFSYFVDHDQGRLDRGFGHEGNKFFTTVTTEKINLTQAFRNRTTNYSNHPVTRLMTKAIVDIFKVINVDNRYGQGALITLPA